MGDSESDEQHDVKGEIETRSHRQCSSPTRSVFHVPSFDGPLGLGHEYQFAGLRLTPE